MEEHINVDQKEYASGILQQLSSLRKDSIHCDFAIKVGNEEIAAHKNVLTASSDYFRAMLSHDTREVKAGFVELKEVDPECVKKCIDFIYTGKATVSDEKREQMMHVANMMQLQKLCDALIILMEKGLDSKSFFLTKKLASTYNCKDLEEKCDQFALDHFGSIAGIDDFKKLQKEYVLFLMQSKETKSTEAAKCKIMIRWINFDVKNRGKNFLKMLRNLDMSKIPLAYRRHLIENEPVVYDSTECMRVFTISMMDTMNIKGADVGLGDVKEANTIFVFDNTSRVVQCYDPERKTWTPMQGMTGDMMNQAFTAVVSEGNVYVLLEDKAVYRISYTEANATWDRMEDRTLANGGYAVVHDGLIYAIQSNPHSKAAERYNPESNTWTMLPDKIIQCAHAPLVATKDAIYCVGGVNPNNVALQNVEKFDPVARVWKEARPMTKGRYHPAVVELNNKIYVLGGHTVAAVIPDVECYDPALNAWTVLMQMTIARHNFGACAVGGKIYAVANDRIDVLDLGRNRWEVAEPLTAKAIKPRASLGVMIYN